MSFKGESKDDPISVTLLAAELKGAVERRFPRVYVSGEISGWKVYPSGHAYFTLKDDGAQISAVMFKSALERCKSAASLKEGAKVLVYAGATFYSQRGNCQLVVHAAKIEGEGDLMRKYLELKGRLEAEGLFDSARKRRLPFMPRRIGIVTSPAGAVIHDICRVMSRRFPYVEARLFPAQVQGDSAAQSLVAGLAYFAGESRREGGWKADVVIIGRGGGSFEDLFCFNDESLARAVASSPMPVISAVGHETDFTLCDFAADVRAGTPSMAAEIAVPSADDLFRRIASCRSSIASSLRGVYENGAQKIDYLSERMSRSLSTMLFGFEANLRTLAAKLSLLSPYSVLDRGYTLTTDVSGKVVAGVSSLSQGDVLVTRFADGKVFSTVSSEPERDLRR